MIQHIGNIEFPGTIRSSRIILFVLLFSRLAATQSFAQSWDFVKESTGVKIYTRNEVNSSLKSFKGEITFKADIDKVNLIVGNANNIEWWDKDIIEKRVLAFEPDKMIRYYLVYNVPWPFSKRDLALEARISIDPATGDRIVFSKPVTNLVAERTDIVRIKRYWQKWTVQQLPKGNVHVILEGFVDPGGNIPSWLYNSVITETPMRVMKGMRDRVLSSVPANK